MTGQAVEIEYINLILPILEHFTNHIRLQLERKCKGDPK
jgi:hypothetical protein